MSCVRQILLLGLLALCISYVQGQDVDTVQCGVTVGCFRFPDGCAGDACDYVATWAVDGDGVNFQLQGKSNGWVALGFSNDAGMGADSVSECRVNGNEVTALNSYNEESKGQTTDLGTAGLTNIQGSFKDGTIYCSFTRSMTNSDPKVFDLNQAYYLLMATGPLASGAKSYHSSSRTVSGDTQDITQSISGVAGGGSGITLVRAHGILMMSAWTIFVCTAILLARYYKTGWPETKLCDKMPVWFSIHRIFNVLVMFLTVAAFIIIFVDVKGWTERFDSASTAHPIIGTIVTALAITNPIMALFRPAPDGEKRYIFNWAHWGVGTVATILALVNTYLGMSLGRSEIFLSTWVKYILVAFAGVYVIVVIILEVNQRLTKRKQENFEMQQPGEGAKQDSPPDPIFRYVVFAMYAFFAGALYLTMFIAMLVN